MEHIVLCTAEKWSRAQLAVLPAHRAASHGHLLCQSGAQNRKRSKKQAPLIDTMFSTLNLSHFCTESQPRFMPAEHRHEPTPVLVGQTPFLLVTDRGEPSPSQHLHNQAP